MNKQLVQKLQQDVEVILKDLTEATSFTDAGEDIIELQDDVLAESAPRNTAIVSEAKEEVIVDLDTPEAPVFFEESNSIEVIRPYSQKSQIREAKISSLLRYLFRRFEY
jgi:hypothetical protein